MTQAITDWPSPPQHLVLSDNEVHIWRAFLNRPEADVADLSRLLSPDEIERAGKFRFQKDRDHFITARGTLRKILGIYLKTAPDRILFSYNDYGKPAISGEAEICFNVSHSRELALFAFTAGAEVGIDIEYIRRDFVFEDIAEKFFSHKETAALRKIPEELKAEGFFACWTCKEAYIKALGHGLSRPLESFSVSFDSDAPDVLLNVENDPLESNRWNLNKLTPISGYAAAVAVEGEKRPFSYWQIDP